MENSAPRRLSRNSPSPPGTGAVSMRVQGIKRLLIPRRPSARRVIARGALPRPAGERGERPRGGRGGARRGSGRRRIAGATRPKNAKPAHLRGRFRGIGRPLIVRRPLVLPARGDRIGTAHQGGEAQQPFGLRIETISFRRQCAPAVPRSLLRADRPRCGRNSRRKGTHFVSFANYDYLGLADHPKIVEEADRELHRLGVGALASRLVGGERSTHKPFEAEIAEFLGMEAR